MKLAGVDPSTDSYNIAVAHDGRLTTAVRVDLNLTVNQLSDCDLVTIERPGRNNKPEARLALYKTQAAVLDLAELLAAKGVPLMLVAPDQARMWVCGLRQNSQGSTDADIKAWLRAVHLPHEAKLDDAEIRKMLNAGGALSTADKRDAYIALLYGKITRRLT